jgi:single-strand DNA-binding protein
MSQDNQITLRGFVTAEPRFRETTKTGIPMTEIRVGSTPRRLNRETGEWQDLPTSYYRVKCWRRLAVNTASSLHKGDMVVVRGRFYMNTWVDAQQQPKAALEIEADSVGHDLSYGWTHYLRGVRSQNPEQAGSDAGEGLRHQMGPEAPDENDENDENDAYLASSAAVREPDDDASAEPDLEAEPEAAGSDLGQSGPPPGTDRDGDAERLETMALVV